MEKRGNSILFGLSGGQGRFSDLDVSILKSARYGFRLRLVLGESDISDEEKALSEKISEALHKRKTVESLVIPIDEARMLIDAIVANSEFEQRMNEHGGLTNPSSILADQAIPQITSFIQN